MSGLADRLLLRRLFRRLGPGIVTGAADDDPSGIATHSQAGAQFGVGLMWTVVLILPLVVAVQSISARIGRVTGHGLAANMLRVFPKPVVGVLVALLFVANTVNIGADLAAMGAAAHLVVGGRAHYFTIAFAVFSLLSVVFIPYHRYVGFLKWLTFSLFAYVGVVFTVHIDWRAVAIGSVVPRFALTGESLTMILAIFGTTISPYLFFWQSSQEVEDEEADARAGPLLEFPGQAPRELSRIAWETWVGMGFCSLVAFFIVLTTAVTLNAAGETDIQTSSQAAAALKPIAGEWAWRADYRRSFPKAADWITATRASPPLPVEKIAAPTLLIWGDADPVSPVAVGRHLEARLPNARLEVISGGNHDLATVHPDRVAALIARHLG